MRHFIILTLALLLSLSPRSEAEIVPVWSTGVAVPGEQVVLYLVDSQSGQDVFMLGKQPKIRGAQVQVLQPKAGANPLDPNRGTVEVMPIAIKPDAAGTLQVEPIEAEYRSGRKETVTIPPLPVCSTAEITWYNTPVPYGVLWYTDLKDGYVDQPVRAAVKIFSPMDCGISSAPMLNAVGVKVGNFKPAIEGVVALVHGQTIDTPVAFAKGQNWRTTDFVGSYTPFREGKSDVTGKIVMAQQRSFFSVAQEEIPLPTLSVSALPLPPGAPANFANTVGQYSIATGTTAKSLAMNEAVEVEITVRGTGNLEQLECPKPEAAENWKLIPATRKPITDINNETVGMVFTQLMRPIAEVGGIPAFSFSYFDPKAEEYKNAASRPIPMEWRETEAIGSGLQTTAAEPPPAGTVPVEEMTDIYGEYLSGGGITIYDIPRWCWYLLYLPALVILLVVAFRAIGRRVAAGAAGRARERELHSLSRTTDNLAFLKGIGAFIESRLPSTAITPELQEILNRRDDLAFRPDAKVELSAGERQGMLKRVRRALAAAGSTALLLLLCLAPGAQGATSSAQEAYEARQYSKCLQELEHQADSCPSSHRCAEKDFNMGNCHYRLNQAGMAAYYYARALQNDPWLKEAKANLAFIQRKEGAILPLRSTGDSLFTLLSTGQLWMTTIVCTALLALCIALLIVRRGQRKPWLQACTVATVLLCLLCTLDWFYYGTRETPDISALPPNDIAYVITATDARTAAAEDASVILTLTPSTPVHLLALRGSWSYVETFTGVRGWVLSSSIRSLEAGSAPTTPIYLRF